FYRSAGWDRARKVEQAKRWLAREVSALRVPGHDRSSIPVAPRRFAGEPSSIGPGHFNGWHAFVALGRGTSGLHGRSAAAGFVAHADFRTKSSGAKNVHRR